jgi:hypothetical protein
MRIRDISASFISKREKIQSNLGFGLGNQLETIDLKRLRIVVATLSVGSSAALLGIRVTGTPKNNAIAISLLKLAKMTLV